MKEWLRMLIFYNGLDSNLRSSLDSASRGVLMNHTYPNERLSYNPKPPTVKVISEGDKYQQILEKLNLLEMTVRPLITDSARGYGSHFERQPEEVDYLSNRGGNPYSNTYNLDWKIMQT
ncbi:hypothetical protein EPI10_000869 [Gossypium australe]|uniref:Uncharacterized protein n=1 Tax=Gossypium australe TaxID=47621 RepID=A0A5B6V976_9ROSI|nr:hypothetical protein EPI10_000869 [Gossypium australe]